MFPFWYLLCHVACISACVRSRGGAGGGGGGGIPSGPGGGKATAPPNCPSLTSFSQANGFVGVMPGTTTGGGSSATFTCPAGTSLLLQSGGATTLSSAALSCTRGVWTLSDNTAFDASSTAVSCGTACGCTSLVDMSLPPWFAPATVTFTGSCTATGTCPDGAVIVGFKADGTEVDGIVSPSCSNAMWTDADGTAYSSIQCKDCTGCNGMSVVNDVPGCMAFTDGLCIPVDASSSKVLKYTGTLPIAMGCDIISVPCSFVEGVAPTGGYFGLTNGEMLLVTAANTADILRTCVNKQLYVFTTNGPVQGFATTAACAAMRV